MDGGSSVISVPNHLFISCNLKIKINWAWPFQITSDKSVQCSMLWLVDTGANRELKHHFLAHNNSIRFWIFGFRVHDARDGANVKYWNNYDFLLWILVAISDIIKQHDSNGSNTNCYVIVLFLECTCIGRMSRRIECGGIWIFSIKK